MAVSDDGLVVTGTVGWELPYPVDGRQAFRWTAESGMVGLGDPDTTGGFWSHAQGISGDGSLIVGRGRYDTINNHPAVWLVGAPGVAWPFIDAAYNSLALGASYDGAVVVGSESAFTSRAWIREGGAAEFLPVPTSVGTSIARAVSADGTTIVGTDAGWQTGVQTRAVRWVNRVPEVLQTHDGSVLFGYAYGVSPGGTFIVGHSEHDNGGQEAFLWTEGSGAVTLGDLDDSTMNSRAHDVTDDGTIVVGWGTDENDELVALIWTSAVGLQRLDVVLENAGVDLMGYQIRAAYSVTPDGRVVVGLAANPAGTAEGFVVTLPGNLACPFDLDDSGEVGLSDLLAVLSGWGGCSGACPADVSGDREVDLNDLLLVLANWGPCR